MPITHNNLWPQIVNFESLYAGYRAAARNKRFRDSSLHYRLRLEENIINTMNLLLWKQWQPAPFRQFFVHDPKKRLISAPAFRDRVVHHALVRALEPLFERKFIADSYACRKGKGTHAAKPRKRTVKAARKRFKHLLSLHELGKIGAERLRASVASFMGYMKHCSGSQTLKSTLSGFARSRVDISF